MFNEKNVKNLEFVFDEFLAEMTYEKAGMVLVDRKIKKELEALFKDKKSVTQTDIYALTNNNALRNLMIYYLIRNKKTIIKENNVAISDLNFLSQDYRKKLNVHISFDDEELEKILERPTKQDIECVMNSLLGYTFDVALEHVNDPRIFEELLADATEILLKSIYRYNKLDHESFRDYLAFNLETELSKRQSKYLFDYKRPEARDNIDECAEERVIERIDNLRTLNRIMNDANLSLREKEIIEYKYGITDDMEHTFEEVAKEFNMNTNGAMNVTNSALKKLIKASKKKSL